MFFLLRMVFWLAVVLALLPSGGANSGAAQPGMMTACGQAGARLLHEAWRAATHQTRSSSTTTATGSRRSPLQNTLTAADLSPAWRGVRAELHKKQGT
jgi:hypothetical protein